MSDTKPTRNMGIVAALAALAVLLGLSLARQSTNASRMEQENARLAEENKALQEKIAAAGIAAAVQPNTPAADKPATGATEAQNAAPDAAPAVSEPAAPTEPTPPPMVNTTTGMAPEPRKSGLVLAGTHVAPVEGGLAANLRFNPATTEPLGIVAVVVRLPKAGPAKILGFDTAGSMKYQGVSKTVSADGKFAMFEGTPEEVAAIEMALSVSEPVTADVRGTCGIGPYQLEITPSGATARQSN